MERRGKRCVYLCVFVCLKSITCTLVQNGRFLAAIGYVAPSPRPYNKEKNVVYHIIMYLKSHIELNHGNPIRSQPHGLEPLSPQNTEEKKSREIQRRRRKTMHPIENPRIPRTPQETPKPYHNSDPKSDQRPPYDALYTTQEPLVPSHKESLSTHS